MSYFGIQQYQPQWVTGRTAIESAHGQRLAALIGRRFFGGWLAWDQDADEWFADCPVLMNFDGEQAEINHQKFTDLSITWNSIDPVRNSIWSDGDDNDPEIHTFHLEWRSDTTPRLAALEGTPLHAVELLEWSGGQRDFAIGMVAVSFVFAEERVTIGNGLDENILEFGIPQAGYRQHPLHA